MTIQVKLKPDYCSPDEQDMVFKIVEDNGDRLFISPVFGNTYNTIRPQELVRDYMIERLKPVFVRNQQGWLFEYMGVHELPKDLECFKSLEALEQREMADGTPECELGIPWTVRETEVYDMPAIEVVSDRGISTHIHTVSAAEYMQTAS